MAGSSEPSLYWFVARGSGMIAYILLTATVVLGIAVSKHWRHAAAPRLVVDAAHRWATITFLAFTLVHTVTVWLDPFTHFGLRDIAVPFGSAYRTVWLGLGVLATELALALALSVLVRRFIGYRAWHALHLLTYLLFPMALLHSLGTGTDTTTEWATAIYAASFLAVAGALIWRTMELRAWRRWVLATSLAGGAALAVWCVRGPFAPGWAEAAGTPKALLQAAAQQRGAASAAPGVPALPAGLDDTVSGQTLTTGGGRNLLLRGSGSGSTPLDIAVLLQQTGGGIGGQVQLRTADHQPWCAGPITGVANGDTILATCSGYGQQAQLQITLDSLNRQGFHGDLQIGG
jgi:sulfoxide reductase heme-binding subunit YedZ